MFLNTDLGRPKGATRPKHALVLNLYFVWSFYHIQIPDHYITANFQRILIVEFLFISLRPGDASVNWLSLLQAMACSLFIAGSLHEPVLIYCEFHPWEYTSGKLYSTCKKNIICKCLKFLLFCPMANELTALSPYLCIVNRLTADEMVNILQTRFSIAFFKKSYCILNKISLKFIPNGPIDNKTLFYVMAWHKTSENHYGNHWWPSLLTLICATWSQWVNLPIHL